MAKINKLIIIGFFLGLAYPSFGQKTNLILSAHEKLMIDQDSLLGQLINSFHVAVGRRDTAAIKKMIHFPLRTARQIKRECKHEKDAYYDTYDVTRAGPIPEKEWPKYQKIFLSDQAVKWIPDMPANPHFIFGMDTSYYSKPNRRCRVRRREVLFQIELQKLVDKGSEITFFAPYYPRKGHKKELLREIGFGWINGKCKIISYTDALGLPHSE